MNRPASIVMFERCYIGAWIIGLINMFLGWRTATAAMAANPQVAKLGASVGTSVLLTGLVLSAVITFALWYFVAQRGSVIAKWLVTAFFAFGLISFLTGIAGGRTTTSGLSIVFGLATLVLQGVAVFMLFRPDAASWFDRRA